MYEPSRDIEGATELLIRKNRNGPTGYVDLYFYAQVDAVRRHAGSRPIDETINANLVRVGASRDACSA